MNAWSLAIGNIHKQKKAKPVTMITCPCCGGLMPIKLSNRSKRTYCSRTCGAIEREKKRAAST
jgi:hypothetical protein